MGQEQIGQASQLFYFCYPLPSNLGETHIKTHTHASSILQSILHLEALEAETSSPFILSKRL